jgi:pimeloyl-ACP methyl ester carboxylesterase
VTAGAGGARLLATFAALALTALIGCTDLHGSEMASDAPSAPPGRIVKLGDGRAVNLRCMGRGSPTVILESGFGADSTAWAGVQPDVARLTRVCAYDRAGYGHSDAGPAARDGAAIARDLDGALTAAGIKGPFVLVGHSAGGLYARLFAARRRADAAGLVLLDPTTERLVVPGQPDGLDGIRRGLVACLATLGGPRPGAPAQPGPECASQAARRDPARYRATLEGQLSELDTLFNRTSAQVIQIGPLLSEIPMYVITASATVDANPAIRLGQLESPWLAAHRALAAQSRYGWQRTVQSSHMIFLDRPEVVRDSIIEMVRSVRQGRPPAPLPPPEGALWQEDEPPQAPFGADLF